jgi:hypothetical protein
VLKTGNFLGEFFVAFILLFEPPPLCSIHNRSIPVMRGA